jgi:hypothetical protein
VTVLSAPLRGFTELKQPGEQEDKIELKPGKTRPLQSFSKRKGEHTFHIFLTSDQVEQETLWAHPHDPKAPKCKAPRTGSRGGSVMLGAMSTKAKWAVRTVIYKAH